MPQPILDRLISQLQAQGMPDARARDVAIDTLQRSGSLKPGSTEMTAKGIERTAMGAAGRAKDRAAKASGRSPDDYVYSSHTNRATLANKLRKRGVISNKAHERMNHPELRGRISHG